MVILPIYNLSLVFHIIKDPWARGSKISVGQDKSRPLNVVDDLCEAQPQLISRHYLFDSGLNPASYSSV